MGRLRRPMNVLHKIATKCRTRVRTISYCRGTFIGFETTSVSLMPPRSCLGHNSVNNLLGPVLFCRAQVLLSRFHSDMCSAIPGMKFARSFVYAGREGTKIPETRLTSSFELYCRDRPGIAPELNQGSNPKLRTRSGFEP